MRAVVAMGNVDYNKNVLDHFQNPRNMGEMENPDAEATVGNPSCGDVMKIMIKVEAPSFGKRDSLESENIDGRSANVSRVGEGVISDIKFQTFGCAAAIASSSMTTELAKGRTLDEAENITNRDVSLALGELPPVKEHCSNLAADALKLAIANFREKLTLN